MSIALLMEKEICGIRDKHLKKIRKSKLFLSKLMVDVELEIRPEESEIRVRNFE